MTEENGAEQPTVKTGADLAIEQMQKQIADMQAKYEAQVKELSEANKDLWAACHPAQPAQPTQAPAQPDPKQLRPQADVLNEMIRKKLGITQ